MTDDLLPETIALLDGLQSADAVIGVADCTTPEALAAARDAASRAASLLPAPARIVLVHPDTFAAAAGAPAAADVAIHDLPYRLACASRLAIPSQDGGNPVHPLATIASRLGAKACCIVGAGAEGVTAEAIHALLRPVLHENFDLVLPVYDRHRFDGLINSGLVYPLTRALYGKRADGQLGFDFGFSTRFAVAVGQPPGPHGRPAAAVWPLTEAIERGMQVCQARVGAWDPPAEGDVELDTALAQVLGSLFQDMEQHAAMWQRVRGSQPVRTFGEAALFLEERRSIDVASMVGSFQLGFRNLQDVWARALPPATLLDLARLARTTPETFRLPDELWARVVFDFALGHRLRVINRDHLLRAMAPIYLAWVASFTSAVAEMDRAAVAGRLERLCQVFEAEKPYLIARWRWPDRFNP